MAQRFVDSSVATSGNGQSWATAWKAITNITGVVAGDTVFFSGGPSGGAGLSYAVPSAGWTPVGGTPTNRITYQIGQDSAHNGIATFVHANAFLINCDNVIVSGDAGDGLMHFKLQSGGGDFAFNLTGHTNVKISYINGQQKSRTWFYAYGNGSAGFEIDHCYYYKLTETNDDIVVYLSTNGQTYDNSRIHHNEFHSPRRPNTKPDGFGDDFFQSQNTSGVSFYNNRLIGYAEPNYLAGQHQDGFQSLGADHVKYYNNYIENVSNYPFYGDPVYAGMVNVYVFNNIIVITDPQLQVEDSPQGISVGSEMNNAPLSNLVACNNLILDYGAHYAINIGEGGSGTTSYGANIGLWNNIATNNTNSDNGHPTFGNVGNAKVANINNVNFTPLASGASIWRSYTKLKGGWITDGTADFHLVATATTLIGQGTNLSANAAQCPEIMFDRDGVQRPATGPWDIGPYQFAALAPTSTDTIGAGRTVVPVGRILRGAKAALK